MGRFMTTGEIAALLNGKLTGSKDMVIRGLAKIEDANPNEISFLANVKYTKYLETSRAGAILVSPGTFVEGRTLIEVDDPYNAFLNLIEKYVQQTPVLAEGIHPSAAIDPSAQIADHVTIGALSYVGPNVSIGKGSVIHPHVVVSADVVIGEQCVIHSHVSLRERVQLGNRVIIQNGAVIGSDGFGFAPSEAGYRKIPQVGSVVIQDDVEVGANTTIDRASMGETVICKGTKLDNLIQIAHNVVVGSDTVIAAQTGVSGSTKIGSNCRIGGQVGIVGHLNISDSVIIAAKAGVSNDLKSGMVVSGSPERPHALWKRIEAALTRLPDLLKRVRKLETAVYSEREREREAL